MTTNQTNVDLNIIKQDLQELYLLGKNKYYSNDLMTENEGLFLKKLNQDLFHDPFWIIPNRVTIRWVLMNLFRKLYYSVYQIPYEYMQANNISIPSDNNIEFNTSGLIRKFLFYINMQDIEDGPSFYDQELIW